jgi:hypothetical protein
MRNLVVLFILSVAKMAEDRMAEYGSSARITISRLWL